MKHEYKDLMKNIQVPEALENRVLSAAREKRPVAKADKRPVWRAAVCAVLALALVLGGVGVGRGEDTPAIEEMEYALGLTVYAAERGANGGVFLPAAENPAVEKLKDTTRTLSITFADGSETSGTYRLEPEELRTSVNEDGSQVLVPVLTGDEGEVTGLYAVPEDSVWFQWPMEGSNTVSLSNRYGYRVAPGGNGGTFHAGIDIPAEKGAVVKAAAAGTVTEAAFDADRGNYVVLDHGEGMETVYAHCLSLSVETGETVETGQEIAAVGSTGRSTGPHLCFQVWQDGEAQNPVAYFDSAIRDTLSMG